MTRHPAKFTDAVLDEAICMLPSAEDCPPFRVLDPFAGTGKGVDYLRQCGYEAVGIELEPEWANLSPHIIVGNALHLPFAANTFDAIVTSPCYGNRMADHHKANDDCRSCHGAGARDDGTDLPCRACGGTGLTRRNTYTHALGRKLHNDNSGAMQWGDTYRAFHRDAWQEATRVLRPGGLLVLNVKDHIRKGVVQRVSDWHFWTLCDMGYDLTHWGVVGTPGNRQGANGHLRVDHESVISFQKVGQ